MSNRLIGAIALAVAGGMLGGCATPSQMIADHKMEEMCAKDGGISVLKEIYMDADARNEILQKDRASDGVYALGFGYSLKSEEKTIYGGAGDSTQITKWQQWVFDENQELIAQKNYYIRRGGDFPISLYGTPDSNSCPHGTGSILRRAFLLKPTK